MKIGLKLTLTFAALTVVIIFLIFFGLNSTNSFNEKIQELTYDRFRKTLWANEIIDNVNLSARAIRNAIISDDQEIKTRELNRLEGVNIIVKTNIDSLKTHAKTEREKILIDELVNIRRDYLVVRDNLVNHIISNNQAKVKELLFGEFRNHQDKYFKQIEEIINYQENYFIETAKKAEENSKSEYNLMTIVGIFSVLLSVALTIIITRNINKPLNKAVRAAENIANGNFNVDLETKSNDETAQVLSSMKKMSDTIKNLVNEINIVSEAARNGKLDVRGKASNFTGEYKNVINGFNATLDAIIAPLNVTAEYIDRISKGDIPPKIVEEYRGDFNEIKNNINQCIDAINLLLKDTYDLVENATQGRLNYRADTSRHQGDFRRLIEGINATLDRLVGLIDNMPVPVQIVDKNNNLLYKNTN